MNVVTGEEEPKTGIDTKTKTMYSSVSS